MEKAKLTCGGLIKECREEKGYTINDMAFEMSKTKEEEDVKKYEKKIIAWEKNLAYPNLEEAYLIGTTLGNIDPTELIILKDRHRKNLYKTNNKRKYKKVDWDKVKEYLYYFAITFMRFFIGFAIIFFAASVGKLYNVSLNGPGFSKQDEEIGRQIEVTKNMYNITDSSENIENNFNEENVNSLNIEDNDLDENLTNNLNLKNAEKNLTINSKTYKNTENYLNNKNDENENLINR